MHIFKLDVVSTYGTMCTIRQQHHKAVKSLNVVIPKEYKQRES